ncbi:hypothetical protein MAR_005765 [Mya arenaria]|uniref:Uncharacterized protein n=1 Tax=Mya arenaria TaxID=6604 RepID=A0ABY7F0F6_MYAAR|nr:uncharacterized protein LOC128203381 [Mya arenaria]WAR15660.1 hypothetical protein MAR_005765 [Mya arenaria]
MATSSVGLPPCVKLTGGKRGAPGPLIVTTSDEDSSDGENCQQSPRALLNPRPSPRANVTDTYPSLKLDLSRTLVSDKLTSEKLFSNNNNNNHANSNVSTNERTSHGQETHRHERTEVRLQGGAHTARAASRSPEAGYSAHKQACDGYEHDHDYENVASPSGSSTASGPVYVRPPGFTYHAQEIRRKKKKSGLLDRREGLKSRAPTPPKVKPRRDPLPMRLRALPQSFWKQPNNPPSISPGNMFSSLPPLSYSRDDDGIEPRPITPPEDREKKAKPTKAPDRKLIVNGDAELFLKHLFADVMEEGGKKGSHGGSNAAHLKRGRPPKKMMTLPAKTSVKGLISGEDPYMIDCSVTQKLFPQLSLESSTRQGHGGMSSLQLITLREGDKSVTLPSLSIEQNYSQMLSELVMNI